MKSLSCSNICEYKPFYFIYDAETVMNDLKNYYYMPQWGGFALKLCHYRYNRTHH